MLDLDTPDQMNVVGYLLEALDRGASQFDLMQRAMVAVNHYNESRWGLGLQYAAPPTWSWSTYVDVATSHFKQKIVKEFACLDDFVRRSFDFSHMMYNDKGKLVSDKPECIAAVAMNEYAPIRIKLYVAGYDDPAAILRKITPATFLEKNIIGGLHPTFTARLPDVKDALNESSKEALSIATSSIGKITGFVPRTQRGSTEALSNHAAGLAIDIDETFNPDIGGLSRRRAAKQEEILILKEITGYDFGKDPLKGSKAPDVIENVWRQEKNASDLLRSWLQIWMEYDDKLKEEERAKQGTKPMVHLAGTLEYASRYPLIPRQTDSKYHLTDQPLRLTNDLALLHRLQALRTNAELRHWQYFGILSIPLSLVRAMVKTGFRWGGTYPGHKDLMHFELELKDIEKPDSDLRPLDSLPPLHFSPRGHTKRWTLLDQN